MKKAIVKKIRIEDRIFIEKDDIEDIDYFESLYTYNLGEEIIVSYEDHETYYTIPSNSYYKLEWEEIVDNRTFKQLDYELPFSGTLRSEQQEAVDKFFIKGRARSGVLQAKCGFGKTFAGCAIIARNRTKTLILVHTTLLFNQWVKELKQLLPGIPIGMIGDGNYNIQDITVAIYKSAHNRLPELSTKFSTLIVDECHMAPANMFSRVVNYINAKIKIGISATPKRKDGKHVLLKEFFSPFLVEAIDSRIQDTVRVKVAQTDFPFPIIDPKRDWAKGLTKIGENKRYLEFIAEKATQDIANGRCPLILGERVAMLEALQAMITDSVLMIGATSDRDNILSQVGKRYKTVLTTKIFDEGVSCHRLDTLYLTCPSNNPTKLEQRIGRIEREHEDAQFPLVRDFWLRGRFVERQQHNRMMWYQKRGYIIL